VLGVILGAIIVAISINSLIIPNGIADGGVTGIAIIIYYLLEWPVGWVVLGLNIPLFLLGLKFVGRSFLLLSLLGVVTLSAALDLTTGIPALTKDLLLASIFGGVMTGIGMGIIFRSQGSLGGTDILAVLFSRVTSFSVGQILLGIDAVIFLGVALLFGPEIAMYAMIYMFIVTKVIDFVQEGLTRSKAVLVISNKPEIIAHDIMTKLERGVTYFDAEGAYSGDYKKVLYCVVNRTEFTRIKDIIFEHDPQAFITTFDAPEVVGEGFSSWRGH